MILDGEWNDSQIEVSLYHRADEIAPEIFPSMDLNIWMVRSAFGDEWSNQVGHDGLNRTDGDLASKTGLIAELLRRVFDFEQDAPSSIEEGHASFGEDRFAPQAMEKFMPNLAFKIYYLLTKRWLSYIAPF